jgi:hypothetical protein
MLQKLDERSFLFVIQARVDDGGFAFISEPEVDSFCFLSRPHRGHGFEFACAEEVVEGLGVRAA